MCIYCEFQYDEDCAYWGHYRPMQVMDSYGKDLTAIVLMKREPDGVYLELTAWDTDRVGENTSEKIKIAHCPFCGRRFDKEEVQNDRPENT